MSLFLKMDSAGKVVAEVTIVLSPRTDLREFFVVADFLERRGYILAADADERAR